MSKWRNFVKSKFWSWATLGGNKVADAVYSMFSKNYRKRVEQENYEQLVRDKGYTLEEWFAAFPEEKEYYDSLGVTLSDAFKQSVNNAAGKEGDLLNTVQGVIDSATGQRDVKENERNRQFQSEQAELTRQWEAEQAQVAREWDSIGAQMERAAAAGVNPISIAMQNGGINASATSPMPSAPSTPAGSSGLMHGGALDIAQTVFQGIGTFAEQRLKQSQSDDIVAMRQYNIAEKIANTDHLRSLNQGVGLSNVAQTIQNEWLDKMNQATYDNMMKDLGYKDAMSEQARSVARLNGQQILSIKQDMELNLKRFNATLPLELQLTEAEIDLKRVSVQEVYTEIAFRHLQAIEQESRNVQAAAEAEIADVEAGVRLATYEDAINSFHNNMVKGAAEAGVALNDYIYYGSKPGTIANVLPFTVSQAWINTGKGRQNNKYHRRLQKMADDLIPSDQVHGLE